MSPEACLLALVYSEPQQLLQVQGKQAFSQREFWGPLPICWFQEGSTANMGEPNLRAAGVLGPDLPQELQQAQLCGAASREAKPVGLHIWLTMEQWKPWVLLAQR
jgi:hypothetical protein